jgi:hypothetical protein
MLPVQYYVASKRREHVQEETNDLPGAPMCITIVASFFVFVLLVGILAYNLR